MPKTAYASYPGDQNRTADDQEKYTNTAASATAGGVQAVPATVAGYINVDVNGVTKKVPYFNI